jgi:hypothetical protein
MPELSIGTVLKQVESWNSTEVYHPGDRGIGGNNIKVDLNETKCKDVYWIHLIQFLIRLSIL